MITTITSELSYNWSPEKLLEIELTDPDKFLLIKETLTRIGVASKRDNTLFQSAHILHKRGRYYIVSFLELFALDGRPTTLTQEDVARRNTIAALLEQWGLCGVVNTTEYKELRVPLSSIKVISHKDKGQWNLMQKYSMRGDRVPR